MKIIDLIESTNSHIYYEKPELLRKLYADITGTPTRVRIRQEGLHGTKWYALTVPAGKRHENSVLAYDNGKIWINFHGGLTIDPKRVASVLSKLASNYRVDRNVKRGKDELDIILYAKTGASANSLAMNIKLPTLKPLNAKQIVSTYNSIKNIQQAKKLWDAIRKIPDTRKVDISSLHKADDTVTIKPMGRFKIADDNFMVVTVSALPGKFFLYEPIMRIYYIVKDSQEARDLAKIIAIGENIARAMETSSWRGQDMSDPYGGDTAEFIKSFQQSLR